MLRRSRSRSQHRGWLVALAAVALLSVMLPSLAQARRIRQAPAVAPFNTGVVQDQWPQPAWWLPEIRQLGASYTRFEVSWSQSEPRRPASGSDATNPANPAYDWQQYIDSEVRAATAAGLSVMLTVDQAPAWAEAPGRPSWAWPGTWEPDPAAFGQFAAALARRYSGTYPDPQHPGQALPAVHIFQAWNEPNEPSELNPQWQSAGGQILPASPLFYRPLLNAFYSAVKSVSPSNQVVSAGLAPYGDPPGVKRMQPVTFLRSLLCVDSSLRSTCNSVSNFDAQDVHPYSPKSPNWHAMNADDVAIPDVYKLTRVLAAAQRLHHTSPGSKSIITTEFSWDTNPPDPHGISLQTQARWAEQALYVLWQQGVHTMMWWRLTDEPPGSLGYAYTHQSGLLFQSGGVKPSATAFRFPFVSRRLSRSKLLVWGRAPASGVMNIQRLSHRRWGTLSSWRVSAGQVFQITLTLRGAALLRATVAGSTSLNWPAH